MPLLLEDTLLDECVNRLINQVAVRIGDSHSLASLDSTWLNFDHLSLRRHRFDRLGRLRLGWRFACGLYMGRGSYLERSGTLSL